MRAPGAKPPGARRRTNCPACPSALTRQTIKGIPMESHNISIDKVIVEHVTIRSGNTFAAVRASLEALVPRLDGGFQTLLRFGLIDRARQELEAAAVLSIFASRDHGALLAIAGLRRRAVQYDIGNPLTASLMTRHKISAALYAPIRVLLRESPEGEVAFEYDRPVSTFGQFGDDSVDSVARKLDENLRDVLQKAAN
jgi:uncharacterized protein (DUF302 family)